MKAKTRKIAKRLLSELKGSNVLTSAELENMAVRMANELRDYEARQDDTLLLESFKEVYEESDPELLQIVDETFGTGVVTKDFYHRSVMVDNIESFLGESVRDRSYNRNMRVAVRALLSSLPKRGVISPIIIDENTDLTELWSNKDASAGVLGGSKIDNIDRILSLSLRMKALLAQGDQPDLIPAIGFHRGQISSFVDGRELKLESLKMKDRLVWGYDGGTVTLEAQYAVPLIDWMSKNCFWYSGGKNPDVMRGRIGELWRRNNYWYSIDYSKFDQNIPPWLIHICFGLIRSIYNHKYDVELNYIEDNFINTKIVLNGGLYAQKHKGLPSGSNFTQVIGSMCNALMILTYLASSLDCCEEEKLDRLKIYLRSMNVIGDDNLFFTPHKIDLEKMSRYVEVFFGAKAHPDKCTSGSRKDYPEYTKREWRENGEYQNPIYLIVNTCHPEHARTYDGYSPWHILYGLFLTYTASFPEFVKGVRTEEFILEKMQGNGGVGALANVPYYALPGVYRAYGKRGLRWIIERGESKILSLEREVA